MLFTIFQIAAIILLVSILLAVWSLQRQTKMEEVKAAKKELQKGRIVYDRSSSKGASDL